ncbi:hypothetical protein F4803DRAFT_556585 [Xylaria telfairii]|nr:hypothetical protein F4803DRAFT_556585 [Xylaria telfairii]
MESSHEYFQIGYMEPNLDNGTMSTFLDYQPTDQDLSNGFSDDIINSGINDDVEQWQAASMAAINACYSGSAPILTSSSSDRMTLLAAPIFTPDSTTDLQHQAPSADMDFMQETFVQHPVTRNFSSDSIAEPGSRRVTAADTHKSEAASPKCACQQRIIFLIDELESLLTDGGNAKVGNVGAALATHKEAVRYGESMLSCERCLARLENMTLLTILAERLVRICEGMVASYLDGMQTWDSPGKQVVWFGEYELDSPAEWDLLLGNAIFLQLRALYSLVERMNGKIHIQGSRARILISIQSLCDKIDVARNGAKAAS